MGGGGCGLVGSWTVGRQGGREVGRVDRQVGRLAGRLVGRAGADAGAGRKGWFSKLTLVVQVLVT